MTNGSFPLSSLDNQVTEFVDNRIVELLLAPLCLFAEGSQWGDVTEPHDYSRRVLESLFAAVGQAPHAKAVFVNGEPEGQMLLKSGLADFYQYNSEHLPQYQVRPDAAMVAHSIMRLLAAEPGTGSPVTQLKKKISSLYAVQQDTEQGSHQLLLEALSQQS